MRTHVIVSAAAVVLSMAAGTAVQSQSANALTAAQKKQGWVLLFNGASFDGWRQCNGTGMPANWMIEDQAMKVFTAEGKKPGQGSNGDILYGVKKYRNFELSIDWKTEKAGNSGIFYNVREVPGKPIYYAAPEVQVLDNVDATDNKLPSHLAGSLYDMRAADPKSVKPVGQWNTIIIRVKDGNVTHCGPPHGMPWSRTASSRHSPDSRRVSPRRGTSASRITATPPGSGTSRSENCDGWDRLHEPAQLLTTVRPGLGRHPGS
jgi:hypothetical protein